MYLIKLCYNNLRGDGMPRIKLLREPGFIYDLIFVFYLKFNTKLCIQILNHDEKEQENIRFFNEILEQFSEIPEDLYVFFHALDNGRCFITRCYFNNYQDSFTTTYNFKLLQNELSDKERLIRNLLRFYFHDLSEEKVEEFMNSKVELFSCIKESKYSSEEKSKLYEFFINPEPYIQTLQFELMSKEFMLTQYYEKNYQKILEVYNQTSFELLSEQVKEIKDLSFIEKNGQELYVSYCLVRKLCINLFFIPEGALYILGYDYLSVLDFVKEQNKDVDLQGLGNALCEESRVKILLLLLEQKEVTCKDLERLFSFSGSTAYHHMTMMVRIGLIKTRNEGKTIFYSLNRKYFDTIIGILSKFSNK